MGPSPVDRARPGSKHHLLVDATGIPLAWTVTGGNRNDVTQLVPLLERIPPMRGKVGRPRRRPQRVTADRGYDHDKYRRELRRRGIAPEIARRQTQHGSGLGRARWVVERTFAWLHHFKRLLVRYDRRHEIHEAFLAIGCCLVCFRRLSHSFVIRALRHRRTGGRPRRCHWWQNEPEGDSVAVPLRRAAVVL
jgi:transposase